MSAELAARLRAVAAATTDDDVADVCLEAAAFIDGNDAGALVHDAETGELCAMLADRVAQQRGRRPKVTARWVKDMGLLLRRGPKHVESEELSAVAVAAMIDAVFDRLSSAGRDGFCWADQIRSPSALRDHWEQLEVALRRLPVARETDADVLDAVRRLKAAGL